MAEIENQLPMFEHCPNLRSVRGYRASDGRVVKRGTLYRAGHLATLDESEVQRLVKLGVRTVVDLRPESEREQYPSRPVDPIVTRLHPLDVRSSRRFLEQVVAGTATPASAREIMIESYGRYVTDLTVQLSQLLKDLGRPNDGPVMVHCMVGKDRTGVVVALLLAALGVPRASIVEDYVLSNDHIPTEDIKEMFSHHAQEAGGRPVSAQSKAAIDVYSQAHADFLEASFNVIDDQFGGMGQYLTDTLQLTPTDIESLANRFLET